MNRLILIASIAIAIALQATYAYVLLTANIDDVKNIAHQLVASPIASKVQNIIRRAADIFNQEMDSRRNARRNANANSTSTTQKQDNDVTKPAPAPQDEDPPRGQNASFYLNMIKKVFDDV